MNNISSYVAEGFNIKLKKKIELFLKHDLVQSYTLIIYTYTIFCINTRVSYISK